jgi:hypothetical protein
MIDLFKIYLWKSHLSVVALMTLLFWMSGCKKSGDLPEEVPVGIDPAVRKGLYLGEKVGNTPVIFGEGIVSRITQELNAVFSPDGKELFFTLSDNFRTHYVLCHMTMDEDSVWSEPKVAPFAGRYSDADPIFTVDGSRLYFISKRPYEGDEERDNFDIWFVEREDQEWGKPKPVPGNINDEFNQYYVSLSQSGNLYYASRRSKDESFDIFKATPTDTGFVSSRMGAPINTSQSEGDVFISPDESYMIFVSRRDGGYGSGDLYISYQNNGNWTEPQNLGSEINSPDFDYCPVVSPDGLYFFYTSYRQPKLVPTKERKTLQEVEAIIGGYQNGMGNVYWVKADFINQLNTDEAISQ